jgi:hypothetical protein
MYITFFVKEGNLYRRFDEKHIQKSHETGFIKEKLEKAGFKNINIYNDYSSEKLNDNSLRATFTAQREE